MRFGIYLMSFVLLVAGASDAARGAARTQTKDSLAWNAADNRVSAEISAWNLNQLLEQIASATSWQIYVEPDTEHNVSTKFKDRTPGEALRLLLGNLSFALLPQKNGPSRLYVFRTTMQEATQLIKPVLKFDHTLRPIPKEVVVQLKPGAKMDELAKKLGAKVIGKLDGLNAYRLSFDSAEAEAAAREALMNNSEVESVSNNYYMRRTESPEALAASSGFPFDLKSRSAEGQKPIIGLIDSPVQRTGTALDSFLLPGISVAEGEAQFEGKQPTHGTSMFETMLRGLSLQGKDSSVKILPVDVYGANESSSTFDVARGIVEAANGGATVINLSLGSGGDSELLRSVVKRVSDQGVLIFAAAGNEPGTAPTYPAAYPQVLAVTAGTRDGSIASYANRGEFVDLVAPGSSIVPFNGESWLVVGTSASTAYASGLAASLLEGGKVTPTQVKEELPKVLPVKK